MPNTEKISSLNGKQIESEKTPTNIAPLTKNDVIVRSIKDNHIQPNKASAKTRQNIKASLDVSNIETLNRLSNFETDCFYQAEIIDDKVISESSINSLIIYIIMLLEKDLMESQRLSEECAKNLRILEKKCMKEAKDSHCGYKLYSSAIASTIGATAPIILTMRGMDPTAAGLVGKGFSSAGSVTDGWRQGEISSTQMDKQEASKITDQERGDNQQIVKRLQDLKSFLEQVLQLRLQAARNN